MPLTVDVFGALAEPWDPEFMRRALIAAALLAIVASIVGSLVVLKGMAFIGDALPHASFVGVAAAFALGANLQLGGAIAALFWALAIGFITRHNLVRYDTAIGLSLMAGFAGGVLIMSRQDNYTTDLFAFVFGNVLAVSWGDVWLIVILGAAILALVALFYKEVLFFAYDPSMAAASGLPVTALHYGLLMVIGLTVVIGLQVMGIVLVLAMLVAPPAAAQLLTRSLPAMMAAAAVIGALSALVGLYIAWYADVSASAAIVLTATGAFLLAFFCAPGRGLLWRGFSPAIPELGARLKIR